MQGSAWEVRRKKPKVTLVITGPKSQMGHDGPDGSCQEIFIWDDKALVAKEKMPSDDTYKVENIDRLMVVTKVHQRVSMTSNALFHLDS